MGYVHLAWPANHINEMHEKIASLYCKRVPSITNEDRPY